MGQSLSAEKRERQNVKRLMRNRTNRSVLRTNLRLCRKRFEQNPAESDQVFNQAQQALDKAARLGAIPKKRASRKASRLALEINRRKAAAAPAAQAAGAAGN